MHRGSYLDGVTDDSSPEGQPCIRCQALLITRFEFEFTYNHPGRTPERADRLTLAGGTAYSSAGTLV